MFDAAGPVLGIDPGLSRCGYGAVIATGGRARAVACGVLRTAPSDPLPNRLADLEAELEELVAQLRPCAMSVDQASGLALAVAARARVPVTQYSPNEVKLAVTGDGRAGKRDVQTMVARLLRMAEPPRPPDVADALALALCHVWRDRLGQAVARSRARQEANA
jgi:crossover junction endodeoxyribonuclease RuvC